MINTLKRKLNISNFKILRLGKRREGFAWKSSVANVWYFSRFVQCYNPSVERKKERKEKREIYKFKNFDERKREAFQTNRFI